MREQNKTLVRTRSGEKEMDNESLLLYIQNAINGDSEAFSKAYGIYKEDLFRYAVYMMGNTHDAEDTVQEAVLSAWRNIQSLKEPEAFKVWIFKILSNRCKTNLMKRNKVPDVLPVDEYDFLIETDDENAFISIELKECLKQLTPPDAQIILLSIIGGFKSHELGEIFNMEASTVRSRQKRALEKMKQMLS